MPNDLSLPRQRRVAFNLHGVHSGVSILFSSISTWAYQVEKYVPAMQETQETQVWSWGQEDPLEKGMATHSSILAWEIPWTEEPGGLQSMGRQRAGNDWATEYAHKI